MFSNGGLLNAFSKRLASVSDDSKTTTRSTTTNKGDKNVTTKYSTQVEEVVIPSKLTATTNLKDIPPNARVLPLVHTHDGKECPISIENQRKLKQAEGLIQQIETNQIEDNNQWDSKLKYERDNLMKLHEGLQQFRSQHDPSNSHKYIEQCEIEVTRKVAPLQRQLDNVHNELLHLLKDTTIPDSIRTTKLTKHRWNNNNINNLTTDPQFGKEWLPALQTQYNNDIAAINHEITQIESQSKHAQSDSLKSKQQLQHERDIYDQKCRQVAITRDNELSNLKRHFEKTKSVHINEWNTTQSTLTARQNELAQRQRDLDNIRQHLVDFDKNGINKDEKSVWVQRKLDAEIEVKNAQGKLNAFKKAADAELVALKHANNEALQNYKDQIKAECHNIDAICNEKIREIYHNKANTSIELSFGFERQVPLLVNQLVNLPVIKPQLVQTYDQFTVPTIVNATVNNDWYGRDGDIGERYHHREVKLKPFPTGQTTIIHSTSVPKINVVAKEHTVFQDQIIERPVEDIVMKTVHEKVVVPGQVVKGAVDVNISIPTEQKLVTTKTTTTTQPVVTTNTTMTRQSVTGTPIIKTNRV